MAAETGGEVLDLQAGTSFQTALEKIISNLRLRYTIGFNPSAPGENGSFHRLAVKLAAEERCPGCKLLTRSGYYAGVSAPAETPADAVRKEPQSAGQDPDESLIRQNIIAAGTTDLELTDIPFTVRTAEQPGADDQSLVKVDLQVDFSRIAFKSVEGRHACKLRITVFYADSKGKILGSDWRILEGQLKDETFNQAVKSGLSFSTTVPLKVRKQILKIVVYDEGSDRVGSKMVKISE